jgi:histidinol dehydrogenase
VTTALSNPATLFRFSGRLDQLNATRRDELLNRSVSADPQVIDTVAAIIDRVRHEGDNALFDFADRFDGVRLDRLEVPGEIVRAAPERISRQLRTALEHSARNIKRIHAAFAPRLTRIESEAGVVVTRRPDPLDKVGVYAPGGTAAYASSVLMGAIPARVAGVGEIVLCSPPSKNGLPSLEVLAAASIAGVDRVFAVGGAGAIAALAIGTESVPRVDKVVGPGNAFVAEAKIQLAREVAIDCPAGPSELLIIADASATPDVIAREVMAQAEHDARAIVLVIAIGDTVAADIERSIASLVTLEPRRDIIEESLRNRGGILVAESIEDAVSVSNSFAPEHLLIATQDPERLLDRARCAGTVFVAESSSVVFGDYITGANHVLPTGGMARAYSGLSTLDFVRWTTIQRVSPAAASRLAFDTATFAEAEDLPAHAAAARSWMSL